MIKVLYNNKCPVCSREINYYKKLSSSNIKWLDINNLSDISKIIDKSHNDLVKRLHVIYDGKIYVGIDAFIILWANLPKFRIFSKIISLPIIYQISYILYELLAIILILINYNQLER
ncbi:MAG: DUF393 domain-containing protein [Gammaproteobacteria bacterium]|nr:DUF393 domain-containing protein [Gammaproteobacteria bacterium]|tara:strand:+ start:2085 stop:2435 length:351 start_codon:yes stop_codon:yes gene_type:complete